MDITDTVLLQILSLYLARINIEVMDNTDALLLQTLSLSLYLVSIISKSSLIPILYYYRHYPIIRILKVVITERIKVSEYRWGRFVRVTDTRIVQYLSNI